MRTGERLVNERHAWGILLNASRDMNVGLVGTFWFTHSLPSAAKGQTIALFETRAEARANLPRVKGPVLAGGYPDAKVVPVTIRYFTTGWTGRERRRR